MTRRKESSGDSLELLLDTICNMFGGIVFISILVAVMLQTGGDELVAEVEPLDPGDLEVLASDLKLSQLQLERLQQARRDQVDLISKYIPADLDAQLQRLKSLGKEHEELENVASNLEQSNLQRITKINTSRLECEKVEEELRAAKGKLALLENERKHAAERCSVKLPRARKADERTNNVQVSLHYDRFYVLHKYANGVRIGPNEEDFFVSKQDDQTITIQAKKEGGIALDGSVRSAAMIRQRLAAFSNRNHTVDMTIWPDSFDAFRVVQKVLTEAGYRYSILPCESGYQVKDRGGDVRMSQ